MDNNFFRPAGDLDDGNKYFHIPNDDLNMSDNDKINYLNKIVSNVRENDGKIV